MVSFGSVLGDTAGLNGSLLQGMADAFSKLPQKIIWKMKLEGTFIERIILMHARNSYYIYQQINLLASLLTCLYKQHEIYLTADSSKKFAKMRIKNLSPPSAYAEHCERSWPGM